MKILKQTYKLQTTYNYNHYRDTAILTVATNSAPELLTINNSKFNCNKSPRDANTILLTKQLARLKAEHYKHMH
jgi:hypothetical protein